jgi:WhiB family redox-sensing transcriptional regulator
VDADPELFFPDRGASAQGAVRICIACPVRAECLEWALGCGELSGIWGGLSEVERARVAEQRRRAAVQRWISRNDWNANANAGAG